MTKHFKRKLIAATIAMTTLNANAAFEIYNKDGMTFSADALVNIFYANSSVERTDENGDLITDRDQSRLRVGFLPNYVGLNFSKELDNNIKVGARASFWVTLNDTDLNRGAEGAGTRTGIDSRQFYGTVSGDFGEVLVGKDFGLFNRANIFNDEILLGHGQVSDTLGLVDGGNVAFGNIATGYLYPFPKAQIRYTTPVMSGFKLAVAIADPNKVAADSTEDTPRFEAELTYDTTFDNGSLQAWVNGLSQSSETITGDDQDQTGVGYGAKVKFSGFTFNASGFTAEGVGQVAGLDNIVTDEDTEVDGFLLQTSYTVGANRFVIGYGENEIEVDNGPATEFSNLGFAWFRTIVPGVYIITEYNKTEVETENSLAGEETDTISIGAALTF